MAVMRLTRRRPAEQRPLVGVVVPAYAVAEHLPACLDSLLAQTHNRLHVVVVDDGSPDASGEIAERYAALDPRVEVVHTDNQGLGAARNEGLRHVRCDLLAFADSDDVVPPDAYATLVAALERTSSDFATGSIRRWERGELTEPPWMRRLHNPERTHLAAADHPEILGDVFAWNKLYRRDFWERAELSWAEGVRYEDQPTLTRAYLAGRFDVLPHDVYHWRIRDDASSITQQRASVADLRDRLATKRASLASVEEYVAHGGDPRVREVFVDRVLAGDLHRYFAEIPAASDEWWRMLVGGVRELWGEGSLTRSTLTPVHRLTGWLVGHDRREQATAVMAWVAQNRRPLPRVERTGGVYLDVPGVDLSDVDPEALRVER